MKPFIHDDFLLENPAARELYHGYAEQMPIIDYHCHLPPAEVAQDKRWENMAQVWLGGDHYKWRAMRSNGVDERFITGDASDREKFQKFAETMPYLLRNPLFDWSHLELARYFDIYDLLSPATAEAIWVTTAQRLAEPGFSARGLMARSNVRLVCTTDDPCDTLEHHAAVKASGFNVQVLPTWRPDKALAIDRPAFWNAWLDRLEAASGQPVKSWDDLLNALQKRHDVFAAHGCLLSDYGLDTLYAEPYLEAEIREIFTRVRQGGEATADETATFRSALLFEALAMDARSGWSAQIHYGALRNNNSRMFKALGPDTGFDSIGDWNVAVPMARLFDRLEQADALPRTVIYTLNPRDNEMIGTMIGNFQRGPVAGRMQFGSGWWFNDQRDGMLRQMEALSQLGLLSRFVGMLTDSRSFLSYTRHEYFRRILCHLLGSDMTAGRIPDDIPWAGEIVKDICYRNAVRYFGFAGL
ncbi:MAG TPA: glucuronate isomerase [Kiritimatiellia bacterium]|nr:glucuronate isomerase [Kiritimatiellia bacterium]HRU70482.1 glucuronate isomerase [Kiritimatiellia bacterium]